MRRLTKGLEPLLDDYRLLLGEVDTWFTACLHAGDSSLACRGGCSACCRGLFDITLLDAWILKAAFARLDESTKKQAVSRSQLRLIELGDRFPGLREPYLLNAFAEENWTSMPELDLTPCPLLDEEGFCLVYADRPLTCRLHGLPNVDFSGEDFDGTVCSLHPGDPMALPERTMRWRFREIFAQEVSLFRSFAQELTGSPWLELDTFIPLALLADYSAVDWPNLEL